jgi:TnpA family transposase
VNFGLFDLAGKSLTPRIRDLGKITLVRGDSPAATSALYPHAGPLLADRWNEDLVAGCYPGLLRMGGSLKFGEATASLIAGKWSAASRQDTLAAALHALRRDLQNSVICWTTEYYGMGIGELRGQGRDVPGELLSFIARGHRENINLFGFINVDIEAELAKLIEGWRPLRPTTVTESLWPTPPAWSPHWSR